MEAAAAAAVQIDTCGVFSLVPWCSARTKVAMLSRFVFAVAAPEEVISNVNVGCTAKP